MAEGVSEEASFPDSGDNLESIHSRMGAIQFRVHGLLDRSVMALKHLAALIMRLENRAHGGPHGPPDYPQTPWNVNYYGRQTPEEDPSWQSKVLSIVGTLVVAGILAIFGVLWSMSGRLTQIEEHQSGDQKLTIQRLDAQEKHLEADDRRLDAQDKRWEELDRTWPRRH